MGVEQRAVPSRLFLCIFMALVYIPFLGGLPSLAADQPAATDTERIAQDPKLADQAALRRAHRMLQDLQFREASRTAAQVFGRAMDPRLLVDSAGILIYSAYYSAGCRAALEQTKSLQERAKQRRQRIPTELYFLSRKISSLDAGLKRYQSALGEARKALDASADPLVRAETAYEIARLACLHGTTQEALDALQRVIETRLACKEQAGPTPNSTVIGEAVVLMKNLCLVRLGADAAVRQLQELARSHLLDEVGARAYLCIGDVHRWQGNAADAGGDWVWIWDLYRIPR